MDADVSEGFSRVEKKCLEYEYTWLEVKTMRQDEMKTRNSFEGGLEAGRLNSTEMKFLWTNQAGKEAKER